MNAADKINDVSRSSGQPPRFTDAGRAIVRQRNDPDAAGVENGSGTYKRITRRRPDGAVWEAVETIQPRDGMDACSIGLHYPKVFASINRKAGLAVNEGEVMAVGRPDWPARVRH